MTSKENSIRLKELGFEGAGKIVTFPATFMPRGAGSSITCKVYDAEVLFKWLREWAKGDLGQDRDLVTYLDCVWLDINEISCFKTNLADLLAEAIIWIMENES